MSRNSAGEGTPEIREPRVPLLALLHPREQTRLTIYALVLGLVTAALVVAAAGMPIWGATMLVLAILLVPGVKKWRADGRRYGRQGMVLSVILAMQGFHSLEHIAQWVQYHILKWPMWWSSGLISVLNAEWIHFIWNWTVVAVLVYLLRAGMRNFWAWALLAWALAHAAEHSYMMARYLLLQQELRVLGVSNVSAQGLPGILGRDGWLAQSPTTQGTFLCRLPGLTTATRLDVHFWWNVGEMLLLLVAANVFFRADLLHRAAPSSIYGALGMVQNGPIQLDSLNSRFANSGCDLPYQEAIARSSRYVKCQAALNHALASAPECFQPRSTVAAAKAKGDT